MMTTLPSNATPSRMSNIGASGQGKFNSVHTPPAKNTTPQATQKPSIFMSLNQRTN